MNRIAPPTAEAYWWLGTLASIKLPATATGGSVSMAEVLAPEGYAAPLHLHRHEDEAFHVLEGEVTFSIGDEETTAGPGDVVFGPRGVPHRFHVDRGPARMLYVFTPGGFEGFIRETGKAAPTATLPPETAAPDLERVARVAHEYGNELLG